MPLTITIDLTEGGRFRALVAEQPRLVIEHDELSELVEELKRNLDMIVDMPDGRLLLIESKAGRPGR
jgi:Mrp family chromosome partitioning ATPase